MVKWGNKMTQNINNNLNEKLNEFVEKSVTIIQEGFLKNEYSIHKLKYLVLE